MSTIYEYYDLKIKMDEIFDKYRKKTAILGLLDGNSRTESTFEEIRSGANELKNVLNELAINRSERIAILSSHSPYAAVCVIQLAYIGVTAVLIDANLPSTEIMRLIDTSDVSGIITIDSIYKKLFHNGIFDNINVIELCQEKNKYKIIKKAQNKTTSIPPDNDIVAILFSSGTSSTMKGAAITYTSMIEAQRKQEYAFGIKAGDKYLLVLPIHHMSGYSSMISFILTGCQIGVVENVNATKLQNAFFEYNPNFFGMVPKVYDTIALKVRQEISKKGRLTVFLVNALLNISGFFRSNFGLNVGRVLLKSVRSKVFGKEIVGLAVMGSMCKLQTAKLFLDLGINWANVYGSTECNAPICSTGVYDKYAINSVGKVTQFNDIEIKIHNPDNNGIGEIYVKTPMIMKEYFCDRETTINSFDNGYFKTGDLGYIDTKNYLHITGRVKDSIILNNGEKVSLQDIDNYYQSVCPQVSIASCAVSNDENTDEIHLFVETADKSQDIINQTIAVLKRKSHENKSIYSLAGIHQIDIIPVTSIGKVKRYLLKEHIDNKFKDKLALEREIDDATLTSDIVIGIIKKFAKLNDDITPKSNLCDDLGLDSLAVFELVCEISLKFGVDVSNSMNNIKTVEELILAVTDHSENKSDFVLSDFPHIKTKKEIAILHRLILLTRKIYNLEVIGAKNIPQNENYILCSNHINNLDPIWLMAAIKDIDYNKIGCLAAVHLLKNKFTKRMFNIIGGIPVDRFGNTAPALNLCAECLNNGYSLIVFPEGARTRNGKMLPFKNGAAQLSIDSNKPIIPVRIDGGYDIFPRKKKIPHVFNFKEWRKFSLKITFGEPIYPNSKSPQEITNYLSSAITALK